MLVGSVVPMVVEQDGRWTRSFDIYSRLLRERIVFLGQEVNDDIANLIAAQLLHLDAVEPAFALPQGALAESREVLRSCGNMSSATILFVLERIMPRRPATGVAMAFGPGLAMEGFRFGWTDAG